MSMRVILATIILLIISTSYVLAENYKGDFNLLKPAPPKNSLSKIIFDEYLNFTCPHCNNFRKASTGLKEKYKNILHINYIPILFKNQSDYPLRLFFIAESKGKTEEIKTLLFETAFDHNVNIYDPTVVNYLARATGLAEVYKSEANADWVSQRVMVAQMKAQEVGVVATPTVVLAETFFVTPKQGMNTFVANIENLIRQLKVK